MMNTEDSSNAKKVSYIQDKGWNDLSNFKPLINHSPNVSHKLPAGNYVLKINSHPILGDSFAFQEEKIDDNLVQLTSEPFLSIARRTVTFFNDDTRKIFSDLHMKHFLGVILYGMPGTGKSCFVEVLSKTLINKYNCKVIKLTPTLNLGSLVELTSLCRNSNDEMLAFVADEFDNYSYGSQFLAWTDGHYTPENVLFIATTNNFQDLSPQLTNRPSRFAIKEEINFIPEAVVIQLVNKLLPSEYRVKLDVDELALKISQKKIRIDQVKHILLNFFKDGLTIDEAINSVLKADVVTKDE